MRSTIVTVGPNDRSDTDDRHEHVGTSVYTYGMRRGGITGARSRLSLCLAVTTVRCSNEVNRSLSLSLPLGRAPVAVRSCMAALRAYERRRTRDLHGTARRTADKNRADESRARARPPSSLPILCDFLTTISPVKHRRAILSYRTI